MTYVKRLCFFISCCMTYASERIWLMDFKQIEIFLKVVDYQNLTKVAEELQTTQPVISNTLKRIEKELDTQLFIRKGKTLYPSVQGKLFYELAKSQMFSMNHMVSKIDAGLAGKQEIIVASSMISDWFMKVAGNFVAETPNALITFQSEKNIPKNHRLATAEFMLLFSHQLQDQQRIAVDCQDQLYAIVSLEHPLAHRKMLSLNELKDEYFVMVQQDKNTYEPGYYICIDAGFTPQISMSVDNYITKYASIRCNCGIGLIFDSNLALPAGLKDCAVIPIRSTFNRRTIYLAWYEDRLSRMGRQFLRYIADSHNTI